jgi:Cys-rich four helix bundle protein (predicted Tat secretion target)
MNMDPQHNETQTNPGRRALVVGAGVAALAGLAAPAFAGEAKHDHPGRDMSLVEAAHHCMKTAGVCMSHCNDMFKAGDTSLAECAPTAQDLMAVCGVTAQLAANGSPHLKAMGKVCMDACESCKKECDKHADKHPQCKDCSDACATMMDKLKKMAA